ncbi:MAG: cyclic nucleotide-binding domain-containing protein, partial [bacterium]|nr:cyclic nucleotide-binding domain-containing protein [bacterium]
GIAVDDTIHFLTRFNSEARGRVSEKQGAIEALREVGRPVTITTIGLCMGFGVIATSELKNQAEFGLLGAFTLAVAWLIDVTFTPALCAGMRVVNLWDALTFDLGKDPHKSIPMMRGLTKAQARIAALMTSVESFAPGEAIFRVGDPGDELFVVIEGELLVSIEGAGGQRLELNRCKRGDVVGEVALYHGKRTADVDAVTHTRAMRLTQDNLENLRTRYPRIGARVFWNLSEVLAQRLATATLRVG